MGLIRRLQPILMALARGLAAGFDFTHCRTLHRHRLPDFLLRPYFPASWLLHRIQARRPVDSFVWRHPLLTLAGLIFAVGFAHDVVLEVLTVRTGTYIYSQVIPFGSVFVGTTHQFPVLSQALVTLVMIPAGVLYRDDTGRTGAEKLAQRVRIFARQPTWECS